MGCCGRSCYLSSGSLRGVRCAARRASTNTARPCASSIQLSRAWRSTWIGPVRHLVRAFIAHQIEQEIILEDTFEDRRIRWIFSQITATSFRWRNMESGDEGETWTTVQEMSTQRTHP